jgi:addiction module HigA family antidote
MTEPAGWKPTWAVSPGEILVEALDERGMSQADLGRRMARPTKTISEIATGKAAITPETAIQLERALGISAALWLGLESRYREALARERDLEDLGEHLAWLDQFPVKELVDRRIIDRKAPRPQQAAALLAYFGVSSPVGWERFWGEATASYRMSETQSVSPYAVAIWLREAEREVEGIALPTYDPVRLRGLVSEIRSLTTALVLSVAVGEARDMLASAGVGLLLAKGIRGAPASGAVRWIRSNPWILLTLRHRTDDHLWFSLFHEIGHLLEGGRRKDVVEELGDDGLPRPDEIAADAFARDALLPDFASSELLTGRLDQSAIRETAAEYGVSPSIVVGRLERDRDVPPGRFRYLKRKVDTSA